MKVNELKEGVLLWWDYNDNRNMWQFPAIVTRVDDEEFWMLSFEDFSEVGPLNIYDLPNGKKSDLEQMQVVTEEVIQDYLSEKVNDKFEKALSKKEEWVRVNTEARAYARKVKTFWKKEK